MKTIFGISLAVFGSALAAMAVEPSAALFENDQVKVTRALEKAHVKGGFHEHKMNRVMVYLQSGRQRFEYQDSRKPAVFDWKVGQVVWSPPEGMHSPEVTGDDPFNIIEVELKKPGSGKTLAPIGDTRHSKVELENDQVRIVRVRLTPGESTSIANAGNSVAIFLSDTANHKMGEAVWEAAPVVRADNPGEKPFEMVMVELK